MMDLQTLVLNADYRPLSYNPLSLWSWKDAFTALFLDRVTLVASYDVEARSPSRALRVPSVLAVALAGACVHLIGRRLGGTALAQVKQAIAA